MNDRNILRSIALIGVAGSIMLGGCHNKQQKDTAADTDEVQTFVLDTVVYARAGDTIPSCKLTFRLAYLAGNDSVNRAIRRELFGAQYAKLTAPVFADSLAARYSADYHADIAELLEADLQNGMKPADVPAWYNYEYDLSSTLARGMEGIWNYTLTDFEYTGGAHPNTVVAMLNVTDKGGKALKRDDVFAPDATAGLAPLIVKGLAQIANERTDTDTITSLKGLRAAGILLDADPYIPDNFLLGKDTLTLQYNRYEIAYYAMGDFTVKIPLAEAKKYLKPIE